jgi:hypothetical protein
MSEVESRAGELSERMASHLEHLRACESSGESLKAYAARSGLSIHTLYQAKKVLRRKGVLGMSGAVKRAVRKHAARARHTVRFAEVTAASAPAATWPRTGAWRLRLPSGVVLESDLPLELADVLLLAHELGASS